MPELPEVETIKNDLTKKVLNKSIFDVQIYDARVIRNCTKTHFKKNITGQTVKDIARKGKGIIFSLSKSGYLTIQPMMTGQLIVRKGLNETSLPKATKVIFVLSGRTYLHYNDHRLFGRLNFVHDLNEIQYFHSIGPDPFDAEFHVEWLNEALQRHKAPIKSLLMNQNFITGIGNIYASEILFHSGISPLRRADSLNQKEIKTLHEMTVETLKAAIKSRGTSMNTYRDADNRKGNFISRIQVYGRENEQCFRCRGPIRRVVQAGRSTFFCRRCQS